MDLIKPATGKGNVAGMTNSASDRPAYGETDYPFRAFGWSALHSLRSGKYLYIQAPERELYDLSVDPAALQNLENSSKAVADTMASQLEEFRRNTSVASTSPSNVGPQQVEQLQALGYVTSGFQKGSNAQPENGPDPKGKIKIANQMHLALLAIEDERYKDAIPELEAVLKSEPNMPLANLQLGRAWNSLETYDKAVPRLRKAVELSPESGRAHFELGMALAGTDNWAESTSQLESALAHVPDSDEISFDLANSYDHLGRVPDAIRTYEAALHLNPNHYRANLMLGRLLGMHNDPSSALPYLQKAVKLQPESSDAHKFLANVYLELGQQENARREQSEVQRLTVNEKSQ